MVLALLSVLSILGALHQATKTHDTRALQQRGVTTSATVLRSSYDPDGGDPNGWTTDTVQFRDTQGRNNQADVGHHDNHVEQGTRILPIIYDPHHPTVAVSAQEYANSTPALDLTAAVAITAVLVISALATLLSAFELSKSDTKSNDDRPAGTAEPPRAVFLREGVPRAMRATRWSPELAASVFISLGYG